MKELTVLQKSEIGLAILRRIYDCGDPEKSREIILRRAVEAGVDQEYARSYIEELFPSDDGGKMIELGTQDEISPAEIAGDIDDDVGLFEEGS